MEITLEDCARIVRVISSRQDQQVAAVVFEALTWFNAQSGGAECTRRRLSKRLAGAPQEVREVIRWIMANNYQWCLERVRQAEAAAAAGYGT